MGSGWGSYYTTKQFTDFDRKYLRFWPNLLILTEILTDSGRSENHWSKFYFDRSVKKFWPIFWPTDNRSNVKFDRVFDRNVGQKNLWLIFWPKKSVKIRGLTDFSVKMCAAKISRRLRKGKFWRNSIKIYNFDRIRSKFSVKNT